MLGTLNPMRTKILNAALVLSVALISACAVNGPSTYQPLTPGGSRVIVLDGDQIDEDKVGGFFTWKCKDYFDGGRTLVEVGIFSNPDFSDAGFILYDGGNTGVPTLYQRQGLNRRWDWGSGGASYAFSIKPDGTGFYYDFSLVPDGETTKSKQSYKC